MKKIGRTILLNYGFPETKARFTETHGNWRTEDLMLEDLCVILADKLWKGKRIQELEERFCAKIATAMKLDFWDVYLGLGEIYDKIALGSDKRLAWQNQSEI